VNIQHRHVDHAYAHLVRQVFDTGTRKENRTGVDTFSTFALHYGVDMRDGFPLLTTKKIAWKNIVVEMLWFLSGQTDIAILKRHGCKFWDAWADKDGKVPSAYGSYWRHFPVHHEYPRGEGLSPDLGVSFNDQIAWVLAEMKKNPMSRRMVVSAWAPGNAQTSKLPPCHCLFAFNVQNEDVVHPDLGVVDVRKNLCLHLTQRSCDIALGVPYNIASYALLLHIAARLSGLEPGLFSHTLIDAHIYTKKRDGSMADHDHVPGLEEQISREPRPLPKLILSPVIQSLADIEALMAPEVTTEEIMQAFRLEGYDPHPAIAFKVAV
jgi:thymidylate synthase